MHARWLRLPILHFAAIGLALFGFQALRTRHASHVASLERAPIVFSAERIAALQTDFVQRFRKAPSQEQLSALLAQAVEEELLYREARVLALDFQDASVRRRLLEKMRVVSDHPERSAADLVRDAQALKLDDDLVVRRLLAEKMRIVLAQDPAASAPTEAELHDYLDRHHAQLERPAELTFAHVFVSERVHGHQVAKHARRTLAKLQSEPASDGVALSDAFPFGLEMRAYAHHRIMARFGKVFADRVFALEPGVWSSPIASPYGLHLVRVTEKSARRLADLAAVRQQALQGVLKERAAVRLARGMARLRGLYEIRIAGRDDLSTLAHGLAVRPTP